jgi:hypothetical protein
MSGGFPGCPGSGGANEEVPDLRYLPRLLSLGRERRRQRPKCQPAEERAAVHHWMISSARTKSDWGMVSPRALAVLRLMTSSNFVGCSTGRSARFGTLEDLVDGGGGASLQVKKVCAIDYKTAGLRVLCGE